MVGLIYFGLRTWFLVFHDALSFWRRVYVIGHPTILSAQGERTVWSAFLVLGPETHEEREKPRRDRRFPGNEGTDDRIRVERDRAAY